jgi:hypothetical protein
MRVVLLLLPFFVFSQNTLLGGSLNVNENASFEYEIGLDNDSAVSALQFDIVINQDAFTYGGSHTLTTRTSDYTVSSSNPSENIMRVVMYSSSGGVIEVGSGPILNLDISSKTLPNDYTFSISNVVLSDATGTELSSSSSNGTVSVRGAHLNVNTTSIDFGRVPIGDNEQRSISISNNGNENLIVSAVSLSSPLSLTSTLPLTITPGGSQSISIALDSSEKYDASSEVSFTTNDNDGLRQLQKTTVSANVYAVNEIHIGLGSGAIHTDISIPVSINNMEPFSGFQFDLTLPQDISYVENSVALSTRKSDHSVSGSVINANTLRVIAYSNTNAEFSGSDGEVMTLKLKPEVSSGNYNLTISNPIISNITLGDIESDSYNGSVQINAPNLLTNPSSISFGRVPITETRQQLIRLTNNGSAELNISSIVKDVSLFDIDIATPFTISQGAYKDITLNFTPSSNGNVDQDISIRHNGSTEQNIVNVTADVFSPNYLKIKDVSVNAGGTSHLEIELHNNDEVRGIQFDLTLNSEFSYDVSNYELIDNGTIFSSSTSNLGNNKYRFILYNTSGNSVSKGSGSILKIPFSVPENTTTGDYLVAFSNVVISGPNNNSVGSESLSQGKITIVADTTVPVITLLGDATVTIEVGSDYTDDGATASDNYDGDITDDIVVVNPVDTDVVGTYTITYNVSDAAGNAATEVTRTVNVVDTTVPVITLLGDATVTIEVGSDYTDAGATASDNYDGDITDDIVVVNPVDTDVVGTYTITYNVSDAAGNAAVEVTRTVNVVDTTVPVITLLGDATVTIEVGSDYTDAGATASDNYDGDITDDIVVVNPVDTDVVGTYTITYNVSDAAGNTATEVTRTVNVVDTTVPVITLLGDATVTLEVGSDYTDAGATASDNYDGDITDDIVVVNPVDTDVVGTYTITYNVSDAAGNAATEVTRTVNVVDTTVPVITLLGDATVTIEVGSDYTDAGATASDNYDGDITDDIVVVNPVDTDVVGTYTITYNVSDAAGNAATEVTRTVNVVDTTVPVITLLGDATVTLEVGSDYTDDGATASDNYDGDITDDIVVVNPVDTDVVGTYTITYNVNDAAGNTAVEVIREVIVENSLTIGDDLVKSINIYPNPFSEKVIISSESLVDVSVYNILGSQVLKEKSVNELNTTNLKPGIYIFKIHSEDLEINLKMIK